MTYHPEYTIGDKSPGVWKEVRRLEAEVERLQALLYEARDGVTLMAEVERLRGLRKMEAEARREAQATVERLTSRGIEDMRATIADQEALLAWYRAHAPKELVEIDRIIGGKP